MDQREFFAEATEANRYKLSEVIGKGSYGVVASAVDQFTGGCWAGGTPKRMVAVPCGERVHPHRDVSVLDIGREWSHSGVEH